MQSIQAYLDDKLGGTVRRPGWWIPSDRQFWRRVDRRGEDECWLWTGYVHRSGYGWFERWGDRVPATHAALRFADGVDVPSGMVVCHRCDNPGCVNPAHLWIGTHTDNMQDMIAKGRGGGKGGRDAARGEDHGMAKLSQAEVDDIRALHAGGGVTQAALSRQFGVSRAQIQRILSGARWGTRIP